MFDLQVILDQRFWILHGIVIIFATAVAHAVASTILSRLIDRAERAKVFYYEALLKAFKAPFAFLIWLLGICLTSAIILANSNYIAVFPYISHVKKLGIIIALAWAIIRFIHQCEILYICHAEKKRKPVDKTLVHAATKILTSIAVIIALLVIMQILGLPISGLLAFGGIGGAAIAFASKDLLANFFGSLVIYLDRPFKVGDWIRSPDKQIEGTVEFIGWRLTCIRTFDKRPLYVPNGIFLNISVENPSRMTNRRIYTKIGIRYQDADKMDAITDGVREMLKQHPEIDTQQTLIVNLVEFGPSSLNFMVYTFTKTTNWIKFQEIQHEVFANIINIIESNGGKCALPASTVFLQNESTV